MQINSLTLPQNQWTSFGYNLKLSESNQKFLDYNIQQRKQKLYFSDREEHQKYIEALNNFNNKTFDASKQCKYFSDEIKSYDEDSYNHWIKFCKELTETEDTSPKKKKGIFSIFKRKNKDKEPDMSSLNVDVTGCYYGYESDESNIRLRVGHKDCNLTVKNNRTLGDRYLDFVAFENSDEVNKLTKDISYAVEDYIEWAGNNTLDTAKYRADKRKQEKLLEDLADEINGTSTKK